MSRLLEGHPAVAGAVTPPADRRLVGKTGGMSWQDLVVAEAVARGAS